MALCDFLTTFLTLCLGDLFLFWSRLMHISETYVQAPHWDYSWTFQETAEVQLLSPCWCDLSQVVRLSLCMFFLWLVLALPFLISDPHWYKKCLSDVWIDQEKIEAHRCLSLFVIHPPALLADAMWVHHSFLKEGVLQKWVKFWHGCRVTVSRTHTAFVLHSELGSA